MEQDFSLPTGWAWTTIAKITLPVEKISPQAKPNEHFIYLDISSIDNKVHKIIEPKDYLGSTAPSRARQLVRANDILFSTVRTYLENVALVPEIYDNQIASTGFSVLRASSEVLPKFLFYYSLSFGFLEPLNELQRGTSYPAVRDSDVREQAFPLPPLPEQERIVAKIEELFTQLEAGTAALRRIQAGLKRYKASVLKAACEGRLVAQDPSDEPAEEMLVRMGKKPLEGEGLPALPWGWKWVTISDIGKVKGGKRLPAGHDYSDEPTDYVYIRVVDFHELSIKSNDLKSLKPETQLQISQYTISKKDVYISIAGTIGKVGTIPEYLDGANLTENSAKITDLESINNKFLAFILASPMAQEQIKKLTISTNQPKLALFRIEKILIPLPPLLEQMRIVDEVERQFSVASEVESTVEVALARAARLRQAILKRAFEGRLA